MRHLARLLYALRLRLRRPEVEDFAWACALLSTPLFGVQSVTDVPEWTGNIMERVRGIEPPS
jgi:hypothetical protein